jgi:hypothetical protein
MVVFPPKNGHSRLSVLVAVLVILALCGIGAPDLPTQDSSKQLNCAVSKAQGNVHHTTVAKYAPFVVAGQQLCACKVPASCEATFHQEFPAAASPARSTCPSRAPPAFPLPTA